MMTTDVLHLRKRIAQQQLSPKKPISSLCLYDQTTNRYFDGKQQGKR